MKPICEVCEKGPADGKTLYRVNPKGVPGIWRCPDCLTNAQAERLDPETVRLASIVNPPKG